MITKQTKISPYYPAFPERPICIHSAGQPLANVQWEQSHQLYLAAMRVLASYSVEQVDFNSERGKALVALREGCNLGRCVGLYHDDKMDTLWRVVEEEDVVEPEDLA